MIPNQWYAILDSKEVRGGRLVGFTRLGEELTQGDGPIIAYRRRRQELIEAASGKTAEIA